MRALYDLGKMIASFNFFEWLLLAQAAGAKKIVVNVSSPKTNKWEKETVRRRARSIILPGPALAGLPVEIGEEGVQPVSLPASAALVSHWKRGGKFRRLETVKPAGNERYTVTLRNTQRANGRNSDEDAWRVFADEIGARVIEDYDVVPIHLHQRMALYAGAEMNFFVSNGPAILCSFTEYPCMIFDCHHARGSLKAACIGEWEQYPWMLAGKQYAIWELATLENIRRYFSLWKSGAINDR